MSRMRALACGLRSTLAMSWPRASKSSVNAGLPFVQKSFRHEITRSGVLISRFSTVPFEAMARGVPFIYHNPHREAVPTFQRPSGAFPVTTSAAELAGALHHMVDADLDRAQWERFFRAQVDIDPDVASELRTADIIEKYL